MTHLKEINVPTTVNAYAAHASDGDLTPWSFERRDLRPDDVEIDVLFCGVCHSDVHHVRNDWGGETYPIVPGHEIIGTVKRVGASVTQFHVGEMVGVGCLVDSCRICGPCTEQLEQYCQKGSTLTYAGKDRHDGTPTYGGYSNSIVVSDAFVLRVPAGLDPAGAAPLLCAGITTYSPLRRWGTGPGRKVAVVGLGGLGHMALKIAKAMGAEVTLFSRSPGKEVDARRLGADHAVISSSADQMAAAAGTFDLIIDTVPYAHDLNPYIATLAAQGTIVLVGYLGELDEALNTAPMVFRGRSVGASLIGGIAETQEMLDFCSDHNITSDVEIIEIKDINDAYNRMLKSDVKYRFVIDMGSLEKQ
ncbi:NAD(P)-dependent alcohol dehydrogenase [Xanthomonas arboricola]|uniref:NAD(P)-dependent alcohol dehydrogenase n=1 Tax=Xanthomonas arboricola TaxID=56448 RepID=UPI0016A7CBEE|nr:NAD(P)-dependent alcohol dehydrogenase [Xanthomonas arboricola]NJB77629.1 putative zinc-type alcohol dehydrogenase-like protein [Xanthomonas arboricola]